MEALRLTRRDAIASLVGAPALAALASALAGCSRKDVRALEFPGGFAVPDATLGHLLRGGDLLVRPVARTERIGTAIVGGGVSGLSAAWRLARSGDGDFRVYEMEGSPGGTAVSGGSDVSLFPWGAHYVPVPAFRNPALEAVLEEVGALVGRDADGAPEWAEEMLCREPEERLYYGNRWHPGLYPYEGASRTDVEQLNRFRAAMDAFAGRKDGKGRRAFAIPTRLSSDDADLLALDRMTMDEWLDANGFTSKRLRWLAEYGCRDDFGTNLGRISAWAGIHYNASRLPGEDEDEEPSDFLTWPEGNGRLVAHLAKSASGKLGGNALVFDVAPSGRPGTPVRLRYFDAKTKEVVAVEAKAVILALPKFAARHVFAPWRAAPPAWLDALSWAPWLVANVTLSGRPRETGHPLAWDNVLYDSRSLGYVVATHQTGKDHGSTVFTYYLPLTDEEPVKARALLLAAEWKDLAAAVLADLSRAHADLPSLVTRMDFARWGHAMLRPTPGFLSSPVRRLTPEGGVHFAHADAAGLPLFEEAQDAGVRAAESILAARGVHT
ncbi:MAG TPA: FAD-dependent oxidoreductase [Thermoanaerobaculia bacterium]|nr:FAD-dependent oxidoreductase [Thermoanaerobaculia bacterium]